MIAKNLLLCFSAASVGVVYSASATASVADAITEIATQSRYLADAANGMTPQSRGLSLGA